MKMRKILIALLSVCLLNLACDKKLELEPKDSLSLKESLSTINGINAAVVGMYASMRSASYYGRSLYVYGDLSSDDVYLSKSNSNRYLSTFQKTYAAVDADATAMWTAMYVTISRANNIINAVDNVTATQQQKDLAKGQALFVRALAYFDLVRVFAKPYNQGNGSQLGVPVVLTSDINGTPARNTVAEVYTRIITDLNTAKTLLASTTTATKTKATKYAASALLSRVYLYKGDYANVITEANVVTSAGYSLATAAQLPTFYTTVGTNEEIFTLKFETTESQGADNIGNIYLKPGYGDIRVSPDLVAVFDQVNDLRFKNFIAPFSTSPSEFQNNKYKGQSGIQGLYSPKILRLAEVILNRAEAYAKSNQDPQALNDLNTVRTARGLTPLVGVTGAALLTEILNERRRELMFEGQRFFDLMRNGLSVQRTYCNQPTEVSTTNCTLAPTDNKAVMPIPQAEIDANPGIAGQQNPGY
jgi:hypothetical protein